jgi:hypothetical protein
MVGLYATVQAALSITYALDAYRDLAGEVLVAVVLVRNTLSFAIGPFVSREARFVASLRDRLCCRPLDHQPWQYVVSWSFLRRVAKCFTVRNSYLCLGFSALGFIALAFPMMKYVRLLWA